MDDKKKDAATTAAHSKNIIYLLKTEIFLFMVSVMYDRIHMVLHRTIDVPQNYIYCQYCSKPLI